MAPGSPPGGLAPGMIGASSRSHAEGGAYSPTASCGRWCSSDASSPTTTTVGRRTPVPHPRSPPRRCSGREARPAHRAQGEAAVGGGRWPCTPRRGPSRAGRGRWRRRAAAVGGDAHDRRGPWRTIRHRRSARAVEPHDALHELGGALGAAGSRRRRRSARPPRHGEQISLPTGERRSRPRAATGRRAPSTPRCPGGRPARAAHLKGRSSGRGFAGQRRGRPAQGRGDQRRRDRAEDAPAIPAGELATRRSAGSAGSGPTPGRRRVDVRVRRGEPFADGRQPRSRCWRPWRPRWVASRRRPRPSEALRRAVRRACSSRSSSRQARQAPRRRGVTGP